MNEVKRTLKRMAIYYLLLAINIIPSAGIVANSFPTRNLATIYLLVLSVCLVLYYAHRVVPTGGLSAMLRSLSVMGLVLILLRGIKYSAFAMVGVLARHMWYLYYVPLLLIPLFLLYSALLVSATGPAHLPKGWYIPLVITIVFAVLILTNDLHRQAFDFLPGFADWDNTYTRGWLYYVATAWQFGLYLAAIIILVIKCRVSNAKKNAWIILIPAAVGIVLFGLLIADKIPRMGGTTIVEFPEAYLFTTAAVLECCMQLGLIPTNTEYGTLFRRLSIAAQITDTKGNAIYTSSNAIPLTRQQFALPDGARIDEHTVLHRMPLSGGYGFWQDDMTELDRLNAQLEEAKEGLAQEAELSRLRNELQARQAQIKQRTLVYDAIARRTQHQSQAISHLAESARRSTDPAYKDACRRHITLLGAYIKRYANLMLLSEESETIEVGEMALSIAEVLRYLNYCGIPGEVIDNADGTVQAGAALAAFEAFDTLLEANYAALQGVFVNLSHQKDVTVKMIFEALCQPLAEDTTRQLEAAGVRWVTQREDDVTYVYLRLPAKEVSP